MNRLLLIPGSLILFFTTFSYAQISIEAPEQSGIGSEIAITVKGEVEARSFVTLVSVSAEEGEYANYAYVKKNQSEQSVALVAPGEPGHFEIRVLGPNSPYPTVARKTIEVIPVEIGFNFSSPIDAGAPFPVTWQGPGNKLDYLSIAEKGSEDRQYLSYKYVRSETLELNAPEKPGVYELRYIIGSDTTVAYRTEFEVGSVSASITIPAQAQAGGNLSIEWTGPDNPRDFLTIVKAGADERSYQQYVYTNRGHPATLRLPEAPGTYEVRYLSGAKYLTLAAAKLQVTAANASVGAADTAQAGSVFDVEWRGPANDYDYITIVKTDAPEGSWENYTYTSRGSPLKLRAPKAAGQYEIRYATGLNHHTLAKRTIQITPADTLPGSVSVRVENQHLNGVEVILDASGSMLQQIKGERRINIAKQTLIELTRDTIPGNTPFALRVFGREADSCQTDLISALAPLNANKIADTIKGIHAKNNAKTPIADSLEKVDEDMANVKGERLVILLTDGEETCGGDPAAVIKRLNAGSTQVRVNIVGFAIDDVLLESTFSQWAEIGSGHYFSARDNQELNQSLKAALKPGFEILDGSGNRVAVGIANDKPVSVMPGEYQVRLMGQQQLKTITVEPEKQTPVNYY